MKNFSLIAAAVICGAALVPSPVRASTVVGPNQFTDTNVDGGGTRANFDLTNFATLPAGSYDLSHFAFQAGQNGDAQPVLAVVTGGAAGSGTETYQIIAIGADTTVTSNGHYSVGEYAPFTLGSTTTVYGGFVNQGGQPVTFQFIASGGNIVGPGANATDAHFNPGNDIASGSPVVVGDKFTETGGFGAASATSNNAYLINRKYDFAVTIVPEPASLSLLGLGGLGLLARRRKA